MVQDRPTSCRRSTPATVAAGVSNASPRDGPRRPVERWRPTLLLVNQSPARAREGPAGTPRRHVYADLTNRSRAGYKPRVSCVGFCRRACSRFARPAGRHTPVGEVDSMRRAIGSILVSAAVAAAPAQAREVGRVAGGRRREHRPCARSRAPGWMRGAAVPISGTCGREDRNTSGDVSEPRRRLRGPARGRRVRKTCLSSSGLV